MSTEIKQYLKKNRTEDNVLRWLKGLPRKHLTSDEPHAKPDQKHHNARICDTPIQSSRNQRHATARLPE